MKYIKLDYAILSYLSFFIFKSVWKKIIWCRVAEAKNGWGPTVLK